jgi:hypothetical protein
LGFLLGFLFLHLMNKKSFITSFSFGLIVVVAILLQAFHAGHHLEELFAEKQCNHQYDKYKTEISHAHHDFEDCFACEFTFSNYIISTYSFFKIDKVETSHFYSFFYSKEILQSFRGSLFALRAPPVFIA